MFTIQTGNAQYIFLYCSLSLIGMILLPNNNGNAQVILSIAQFSLLQMAMLIVQYNAWLLLIICDGNAQ